MDECVKRNLVERLDEMSTLFYSLCHDKNCKKIYDCPMFHLICKKRLNICTAIFWKIAGTMLALMYTINIDKLIDAKHLLSILDMFRMLLLMHDYEFIVKGLSMDQFQLYCFLLEDINSFIYEVKNEEKT